MVYGLYKEDRVAACLDWLRGTAQMSDREPDARYGVAR